MSAILIGFITAGAFALLIWFRDRIIRWRAITFSVLAIPVCGVVAVIGTMIGNVVGWIDFSFEMTVIELTGRLSQLVLLCGVAFLLLSLLPTGVIPSLDRLLGDVPKPEAPEEPGESSEQQ